MKDMPAKDMELLRRICQHSDALAFRELYDRHWERLFLAAYRRIPSREDTTDLVQELFVRIWTKRHTLEININVAGYLSVSLKHAILNYYKHQLIRQRQIRELQSVTAGQPASTQPDYTYKELKENINEQVEALPERMREIFRLSREKDLSASQIADCLSISEQTVRNQLSAALHRIRLALLSK